MSPDASQLEQSSDAIQTTRSRSHVPLASAPTSASPQPDSSASLNLSPHQQPTSSTSPPLSSLSSSSSNNNNNNNNSYPLDLRHITSNQNMAAPPMKDRTVSASTDRSARGQMPNTLASVSPTQHRIGSRSPTSIPSSPTSVHSSSSAIFERDIEPHLSYMVSHPHPTNPHRTPRSKTTEPIESSVPSVLDSAATLLASTNDMEEQFIDVEAPVASVNSPSAVGSPVGRGSRSPSPSTGVGRGARSSMLLNLPSPVQSSIVSVPLSPTSIGSSGAGRIGSPPRVASHSGSPKVSPPPLMTNFSTEPSMPGGFATPGASGDKTQQQQQQQRRNGASTPSSIGGSTNYESAPTSPATTTMEHPPHPLPSSPATPTATTAFASSSSAGFPQARPRPSHPPSPSQNAHKRLSFLSYNDILASTPVTTQPLSSLTSPLSDQPPPHIPSVSLSVGAVEGSGGSPLGSAYGGGASRSVSLANSARNSLVLDGIFGPGHVHFGPAVDVKEPTGGVGDDIGGEWEREGLGRGLEERLEVLMAGKA